MNKLGGWRRIQIVITITYMIGALIWSLQNYSSTHSFGKIEKQDKNGFAIFTPLSELEMEQRKVSYKEFVENCLTDEPIFTGIGGDPIPNSKSSCEMIADLKIYRPNKSPNILLLVLVVIGIPILFWCIFAVLLIIVKWVIAGFRKNA